MTFPVQWAASAACSVLLFTAFSLAIDRRVFFSTWVKGALLVMGLCGPLGTLLVLCFLTDTAIAACREGRRLRKPGNRDGKASLSGQKEPFTAWLSVCLKPKMKRSVG